MDISNLQNLNGFSVIIKHFLATIRLARIIKDRSVQIYFKTCTRVYFYSKKAKTTGIIKQIKYQGRNIEYTLLGNGHICIASYLTLNQVSLNNLLKAANGINNIYIFPILKIDLEGDYYLTVLAIDFFPLYRDSFYNKFRVLKHLNSFASFIRRKNLI